MNLRTRQEVEELMDQPGLDEQAHQQALAGLRRVNWISGSSRILWSQLKKIVAERPDGNAPTSRLRVLDVASGGGDVVIRLAERARQESLPFEFHGADISPVAIEYAQARAHRQQVDVRFYRWDALQEPVPDEYDVIMCSLFLHHLDADESLLFLRKISAAAKRAVLINDLRRSRVGYWLAQVGCRLLSRSPIVHVDGPLSVQSAFTTEEAVELARTAGMSPVEITRHWPQRFLLTWRRETC